MKAIFFLFLPLSLFCFFYRPAAPFTVTVEVPQEIYPCGSERVFRLTIANTTGDTLTDIGIAYLFGDGIRYVPQSVSGAGVMETNIADLTRPEFTLPYLPPYGSAVIEFRATAICQAVADIRQDDVVLTWGGNSFSFLSPEYNVKLPQLSLNAGPLNFIGIPGMTFVQTITVANNGFGAVEGELLIALNYPAAQLQITGVSHGDLVFDNPNWSIVLDTTDFPAFGDGDGFFEESETLTLQVTFLLLPVTGPTSTAISLWAGWGCGGDICDSTSSLNGTVNIANANPVFSASITSSVHPKLCQSGSAVFNIGNTGQTLIAGAAMGRNMILTLEFNQNPATDCVRFINFRIAGTPIPAEITATGYRLDLSAFTADPDGSGGLIAADGDSIFNDLPENASFPLSFDILFDTLCLTDCQSDFYRSLKLVMAGKNWLNEPVTNTYFNVLSYSFSFSSTETLALGYAADSTFTATFNISGGFSGGLGSNACPNDRTIIRVVLPDAISIPPGFQPALNYTPLAWSQQGDTLTMIALQSTGILKLPLKTVCDTALYNPGGNCTTPFDEPPPIYRFRYWLEYFCDTTCPVSLKLLCKESLPFVVTCPQPPHNSGGISPGEFDVRRVSLGWTDATMTTHVSPNTPGLRLDVVMPRQEAVFLTKADIEGPGNYDSIQLIVRHFTNGTQPWFVYKTDTLFFTDAETGISKVCPLVDTIALPPQNGTHRLVFPLAPLFAPGGCLQGFHLTEGDLLQAKVYVEITDDVPTTLTAIAGLRAGFAVFQNGKYVLCREKSASLSVVRPTTSGVSINSQSPLTACDTVAVQLQLQQQINTGGNTDIFPYEFFPFVRYVSAKAYIPNYTSFVPGSVMYNYQYREGGLPDAIVLTDTIFLSDPQVNAAGNEQELIFSLPADLPPVDLMKPTSYSWLSFQILPQCLQQANIKIRDTARYEKYVYAEGTSEIAKQTGSYYINHYVGARQLFVPTPYPVEAPGLASWIFDLNYSGNGKPTPYNWLQFLLPPGVQAVDLLEVTGTGNVPVALLPYDTNGNVWAKIGQQSPFSSRKFQLTVQYELCKPDTVRVRSNFKCFDYPPHPDSFGCSPQPLQAMLFLQPKYAQLDVKIIAFPNGDVPLCDAWPCEVKILNNGQGRAFILRAQLKMPEKGMHIVAGSCEIRHGNGAYQPIADPVPILGTDMWVWDSLPLTDGALAGLTGSPLNEYFIRFQVKTDCDYIDGSQFTVRALWENACGDGGMSPQYVSPVPQLNGAPEALNQYAGAIVPESSDGIFVACGGQNRLIVRIQYQGGAPANVTMPDEVVKVVLDSALNYEQFSFANILNMDAAGEPVISVENGRQVLGWPLPPGVAAGEWIEFSFAAAQMPLPCAALEIALEISQIAAIPCAEAPGGACDIRFVETRKTFSIPVGHPSFQISGLSGTSTTDGLGGEIVSLNYLIEKTNPAGDTMHQLTVAFFTDGNGNGAFDPGTDMPAGQAQHNIATMQPGQPSPFQSEIQIPGNAACKGLFAVIDPVVNPCLCEQSIEYLPVVSLKNAGTDTAICYKQAYILGATPNSGYFYKWWPANFVSDPFSANPSLVTDDVQPDSTTFVQLILETTRPGGCISTDTVQIKITRPAIILQPAHPSCAGGTGSIAALASGGETPYTYEWNTGATGELLTNAPPGFYSVTVTEAGGCTETQTEFLESPAAIALSIQATAIDCYGNATGMATISGIGGTGVLTYLWSNGVTGNSVEGLAAGPVSVTATDANGCTATAADTIEQPPLLQISYVSAPAVCTGGKGSVVVTAWGGTPPYTANGISFSTTLNIADLSAGDYAFTIEDANGCSATFTVLVPELVSDYEVHATDVSCFGATSGSACVELITGQFPFQAIWSGGQTTQCIENLPAGTYGVTVTDSMGCTEVLEVPVNQPAPLAGLLSAKQNTCHGDHSGSMKITVQGGTAPYQYLWNNGAATAEISGLPAGIWQVTVTDSAGCQWVGEMEITQPDPLQVALFPTGTTCNGGNEGAAESQVEGGTPPYQYAWDNGTTTASLYDLEAGIYFVTVTDANGCSTSATAIVEDADPLNVVVETRPPTCQGRSDGWVKVQAPLGENFQYGLGNGAFQEESLFENLPAGGYAVVVQNAEGCETDTFVHLDSPVETLATIFPPDTSIDLGQTVTIVVNVNEPSAQLYWQSAAYALSCDTCPVNNVRPYVSTLFKIRAETPDHCVQYLTSRVTVQRCCIWFPNVFAPDSKGENAFFYPIANDAVARIRKLVIFDRWGSMVFENADFLPNDPAQGWDGNTNGQAAPSGVYVFKAEVEWLDGYIEYFPGDVTLIR